MRKVEPRSFGIFGLFLTLAISFSNPAQSSENPESQSWGEAASYHTQQKEFLSKPLQEKLDSAFTQEAILQAKRHDLAQLDWVLFTLPALMAAIGIRRIRHGNSLKKQHH